MKEEKSSKMERIMPQTEDLEFKLQMSKVVDLVAIFLFAVEGAAAGVEANLDFFGLMVVGFSTALAGGVVRDLLIAAIPPQAIRDWRYSATAFTGAFAVFFFHRHLQQVPDRVMVPLDAACLALFAVAGTEKALAYQIHPFIATLMGTITAVGGGAVRDEWLEKVPEILYLDFYAAAALAGSPAIIVCRKLGLSQVLSAVVGAIVCFGLRLISFKQHWHLPQAVH